MLSGCDLRIEEFRRFFHENLLFDSTYGNNIDAFSFEKNKIFSIIEKNEITNNDLLKFYFQLNKFIIKNNDVKIIDEILFDYKIQRLSVKELDKFIKIIDEETSLVKENISVINNLCYYSLISYFAFWGEFSQFFKIVERFLDEV